MNLICEGETDSRLDTKTVYDALDKMFNAPRPKYTYYIHGGFERSMTGLTARKASKMISGSTVVIDPIKNRYYQYGKRIRNKKKIKEILKGR